ncbi:hypothetical protein BCR32DRAFT_273132, partial [Anaeromyces robustus]
MNGKLQPFYHFILNSFRNGIFGFIIFACLFSIIQSFINASNIFMYIGSYIVGFIGFICGAFITMKLCQKCIENVYKNYKISLTINDPDMVSSDDENEEVNKDYENDELVEDENEESTESSSSQSQIESKEENKNSNEEEENNEDEESYSSNQSHDFDDINADDELVLFNSINDIVNTISLNKKMKIFKYPQSCELASRFVRHNISGQAVQLAIEILSKGIKQYPKYIPLFIHFIYFKWLYELNVKKYFDSKAEEDFKCKAKLSKDRK